MLTNGLKSSIINKLSLEATATKQARKTFKKSLKKCLTILPGCGNINKLSLIKRHEP